MSGQATAVFKLSPAQGRELRERLNRDDFQFRSLAHAFFQARGEGVIVSYYKSGKLVVQGKDRAGFQARYLAGAEAAPVKTSKVAPAADAGEALAPLADSLGSDEAGKGDSFGGLAVAAVGVPADRVEELRATTVADSKSLTDDRIRALAPSRPGSARSSRMPSGCSSRRPIIRPGSRRVATSTSCSRSCTATASAISWARARSPGRSPLSTASPHANQSRP